MKGSKARATSDTGMKEATPAIPSENTANQNTVTLSGLLNVLDGFYAPSNVLFVMTTNRIEALDAALLRPGRIDYKLYLGKASERQKTELYLRFFPEATEYEAAKFVQNAASAETMAAFQGLLLEIERVQSTWALNDLEIPALR
jgi:chaperone BCS1